MGLPSSRGGSRGEGGMTLCGLLGGPPRCAAAWVRVRARARVRVRVSKPYPDPNPSGGLRLAQLDYPY